ncbi:MAG TPA: hypothetical protein VNW92_28860 [Polyangiaceae bacterium]|nr:hypothetical protein [Polyangiaceae bacterium]
MEFVGLLGFGVAAAGTAVGLVKRASSLVLALLALGGCGGKAATYEYLSSAGGVFAAGADPGGSGAASSSASGAPQGGASAAGAGGRSSQGADGGGGADGGASSAGAGASGGEAGASAGANGGVAGQLGVSGSAGTAGEGFGGAAGSSGIGGAVGAGGAKACASVTECPRPVNACWIARCSAGACVTDYAPAGAVRVLDAPADCHATTACDGFGHATLVIDQSNAPVPSNQCLVGTCNASGTAGSEPLPKGAPCHADAGGGKCDGGGTCVACLLTGDCPLGQTCNANRQCVGVACSEAHCGGACPACVGQKCAHDGDCASDDCDLGKRLCVADPQCADARQDGNETDIDCGGGLCPGCTLDRACLGNTDCASFACDAVSLTCIADPCSDHRMDSDESDLDCGGSSLSCSRCDVGKKCTSNLDCNPGHICNSSKVCQ